MSSLSTKFTLPNSITQNLGSEREILPVRVKEVILDETHPEYLKYGGVDSIGAIKYSLLDQKIDTSDTTTLPFALPLSNFSKTLPLVNEVVLLIQGPKLDKKFEKRDYYLPVINLFNDINYIPSVEELDPNNNDPGYGFKDNFKIKPLHPFNGDTILQGRNGQSIRLSGAKSPKNLLSNDSNTNSPFTIISNGQEELTDNRLYVEDINKDKSSIYLTSNHIIPLEQSRSKYKSSKSNPISANRYEGAQIILNSGRLFFNSTSNDIQFTSAEDFGVSADNIHLDGVKEVGIDAEKIYLGELARSEPFEPVILGTQLDLFLQTLLNILQATGNALKTAKTVDQKIIPSINIHGAVLEATTKQLQNRIDLLKSRKVFTE